METGNASYHEEFLLISSGSCDALSAQGHEGQTIWVVPSKDLVIVRLGIMPNGGNNWPALYEWNQSIARLFPDAEPEVSSAP